MYTVITHIIKEEHYDDLPSALDAIQAECSISSIDHNCANITISYNPDDTVNYDEWYLYSVMPQPGGNANIDGGNIKVKMPLLSI